MPAASDTRWIVAKAIDLGFDLCGVVPVEALADRGNLEEWLERGYAGEMRYLHDPRRVDVTRVLPDAKSVVVCALNYNTENPPSTEAAAEAGRREPRAWVSRYAWGDDYHAVVGEKLESLLGAMRGYFDGPFQARAYVDTGPVSERLVAQKAGLGWLAKNTCLINEKLGSWFFLGVILTSLELAPPNEASGSAPADLCGNCRLCLDACPTEALIEPYVMDARRCISYLTIELRDAIPEELRAPMGWQVFGCDICQDVCPWNRKAPVTSAPAFQPREKLRAPELDWLLSLSEEEFRAVFACSPVRRAKWRGLVRNASVAAGNIAARNAADTPALSRIRARLSELAASTDPLIAEHAAWALSRLEGVKFGIEYPS
jgi:epoxyqueuosine reductase